MKVFLYRNLHKNCWSVRYDGVVVAHTPAAFVWGGEFSVSKAGNRRVRAEKRKNVHAFVVCEVDDIWLPEDATILKDVGIERFNPKTIAYLGTTAPARVTYSPYVNDYFVGVDMRASFRATKARRIENPEAVESEIWGTSPVESADHIFLNRRGSVYGNNLLTGVDNPVE